MNNIILDEIYNNKLIAIVRGLRHEYCIDTVQALYDGGVHMIEFPYNLQKPETWDETAQIIADTAKQFEGKVLIGAGTVTNVALVRLTKQAGGTYIISPDMNVEVIEETKSLGMCSIPGVFSPSEITAATRAGADAVKIFPASVLGPGYIKAVLAPLNNIPLIAVGGINAKNAADYLHAGAVGIGVGGDLAKAEWIETKQYKKITEEAKKLVDAISF